LALTITILPCSIAAFTSTGVLSNTRLLKSPPAFIKNPAAELPLPITEIVPSSAIEIPLPAFNFICFSASRSLPFASLRFTCYPFCIM
jgi:hypothetical protein